MQWDRFVALRKSYPVEFCRRCVQYWKTRLDKFAVELQNDPTASAYVIVYPGRSGKPGDVQKHTTRIVDYLVNSRGIDARRTVTLVGRTRDELMVELWLTPQGATPPRP